MDLINSFDELFFRFRPYFHRIETYERARALAYSHIITYGRHMISRMICSKNEQFKDWSADYKLFSQRQWNAEDLEFEIFKECDQHCDWYQNAVLAVMDETHCPKTGKKIKAVRTLRDPMSLPYHINLNPAIRLLQVSCVINPQNRYDTARAVPVYLKEAAPAKRPRKNESQEAFEHYKNEQKEKKVSVVGHQTALLIRRQVDKLPNGTNKPLFLSADGSFCNKAFLQNLPATIIYIVRTRKDLKIYKPFESPQSDGKGRHKVYGDRLPSPEEIRKSDDYPWQTESIYATDKFHQLRFKTIAPVLWQNGTGPVPQRLIIIEPLRYRKSKNSKLLYRNPAYFLTPYVDVPIKILLQYYFFRWDIEVNHQDEKSIMGLGDAQVRSDKSVERNPQFTMMVYSLLLLAGVNAYGPERTKDYLPLPAWRKGKTRRPSTLDLVSEFRREIMVQQLQQDIKQLDSIKRKKRKRKKPHSKIEAKKRGFVTHADMITKPVKLPVNILASMLYSYS